MHSTHWFRKYLMERKRKSSYITIKMGSLKALRQNIHTQIQRLMAFGFCLVWFPGKATIERPVLKPLRSFCSTTKIHFVRFLCSVLVVLTINFWWGFGETHLHHYTKALHILTVWRPSLTLFSCQHLHHAAVVYWFRSNVFHLVFGYFMSSSSFVA